MILVVPCFNEESRLDRNSFERFQPQAFEVSFLFVNDGSTDGTLDLLRELSRRDPTRFRVLDQQPNRGKAAAVRAGVLAALDEDPDFVGYWDADLATGLEELPRFLAALVEHPDRDTVFGARVKLLGRSIERRALRHYLGRLFATAASATLGIPIYDTQCGAKLFRVTPALRSLFEREFRVNWTFDVEILARIAAAHRMGNGRSPAESILELPLRSWSDVKGSRVRPIDFPKAFVELVAIRRAYGRRPSPRGLPAALAILLLSAVLFNALRAGTFRGDAARLLDGRVLFVAGQCWLDGTSPYDAESFASTWARVFSESFPESFVFAYPPTVAITAVLVASQPWPEAGRLLDVLNLAALAACLALLAILLRAALAPESSIARITLGLTLASGIGAIPATLLLGQTGMIALAGVLACLVAVRSGSIWLFAGGAVLASIKPQISLLAGALATAHASRRQLLLALVAGTLVTLIALGRGGVMQGPADFLSALTRYSQVGSNRPEMLAGIQPLLHLVGIDMGALWPALVGTALAMLVIASSLRGEKRRRHTRSPALVLPGALCFAVSALFLPLHDYDLVLLMLPLAAIVTLPPRWAFLIAPGLLLAARPAPVARLIGFPETAALIATLGVTQGALALAWLYWRGRERAG